MSVRLASLGTRDGNHPAIGAFVNVRRHERPGTTEAIVDELHRQGFDELRADIWFDALALTKVVIKAADGDVVRSAGPAFDRPINSLTVAMRPLSRRSQEPVQRLQLTWPCR